MNAVSRVGRGRWGGECRKVKIWVGGSVERGDTSLHVRREGGNHDFLVVTPAGSIEGVWKIGRELIKRGRRCREDTVPMVLDVRRHGLLVR
jgi:hypothetical protein